jgi:hypothetical protein
MSIWVRLRFAGLVVIDRLFGTHLVERELARLEGHIAAFEARASALQQQIEEASHVLHVVQVELCVLYLYQRRLLLPETWHRFAPAEGADEENHLDLLINRLVKHGLATVRTEAAGERAYVYYLQPDWEAIAGLLGDWQELMTPVVAAWLDEIRSNEHGEIRD